MTEKHSPLPWRQINPTLIRDANGACVGYLGAKDAPLIVRSVNALPEAIAALSDAALHLRFAQSGFSTPEIDNDWLNKRDQIVAACEVALAKLKAES